MSFVTYQMVGNHTRTKIFMENGNRKTEIVEAAKLLFSKNGYSPTSMDEIAQKVGISKASLYYFFEGKEQIFAEIVGGVTAEVRSYLHNELAACESNPASLASTIDRVITICLKNGIVIRPVDLKMANIHPIIFSQILPLLAQIKQELRKVLECHGVKQGDLAAEVLVNSVHAYVLQRKHGIKNTPQKDYSDYLASLFIK